MPTPPIVSPGPLPPAPASKRPWRPGAVATGLVVGAGVALGLGSLGLVGVRAVQHAAARHSATLAQQTALRLDDWIESRMLVLESIRLTRSRGLLSGASEWRALVGADLEVIDGFQAVNWVDARGFIEITAPETGNESALGRRVDDHPVAGPVITQVRSDGSSRASPPIDLFQGGRGFTTYLQVRGADGRLTGFVNGVFRVDRIVQNALSHLATNEHHIRISDGDALLWESAPAGARGVPPAHASLQVLDRRWDLQVSATAPAVPPQLLAWGLALTLLSGLGAGLAAAWARQQALNVALSREENLRLASQVEEAQRMEVLGHVAGAIAHDFNNLLTVVMSSAELIELGLGPEQTQLLSDVEAILDAGDRGSRLVASLRTFAHRGEDAVGEVEAIGHLRALSSMLKHLVGPAAQLSLRLPEGGARLGLSETALDRIVVNLVTNAREALTAGEGLIELSVELDQDLLHMRVSDSGKGMTAEVRRRIFEPYFTTRSSGTGLGLATVFGLVRQAGGGIDVQSTPGEGSSFTLSLPLLQRHD